MEPRQIGPYKMFDNDDRGNYAQIDNLGNGLTKKFPLEKLKIVPDEQFDQNVIELKKILKDRTIQNK